MPFCCSRFQSAGTANVRRASRSDASIASPLYSANRKPVPRRVAAFHGCTESTRPPVARTTGTVP